MAGSLRHVIDDNGNYRGVSLLDDMGDMEEAIEELAFVVLILAGKGEINKALNQYYACCRREAPWPAFMKKDD